MHERKKALERIEAARTKRPDLIESGFIAISTENKKLKNTMIFSIPAVVTCGGATKECIKWCYAKKAEIAFPNVIEARIRNWDESKKETFIEKVNQRISELSQKMKTDKNTRLYFRIHESGDFYSQDYLNKWAKIVKANKSIKFLAYTKSFHLDFSEFEKLKNVVIRFSYDHTSKERKEKPEFISSAYVRTDEMIIKKPDIIDSKMTFQCFNDMKCNECRICWNSKKPVSFELH